MTLPEILLTLIPWRLVIAGILALASLEIFTLALWHAAITNRKQYR